MSHKADSMPFGWSIADVTVAEAAEVIGRPVNTVRSWFHSGVLGLRDVDISATKGATRFLSRRRVLQLAIASELIRLFNIPPAQAAQWALSFTDVGGPEPISGLYRDPSELFPGALTWLVKRADEEVADVVPIVAGGSGKRDTSAVELLFSNRLGGLRPSIVLPLDPIVRHVRSELERRTSPGSHDATATTRP